MILRNAFQALGLAMMTACAMPAASPACAQAPGVGDLGDLIGVLIQGAAQADMRHRSRTTIFDPDPIRDSRAYTIDGQALGERLDPGRLAEFDCRPSEQFAGARWCRSRIAVHEVQTATSILLASDGSIQYYSKYYPSAVFKGGAVVTELRRLSGLYHEQPRLLRMPGGTGADGIIAVWGSLSLVPLDQATLTQLATGQPVTAGILVDFLGKAGDSARSGLPVFRLSGGPGYFWAARFDASGQGTLRFGMGNPAAYDHPPPTVLPSAPDAPSPPLDDQPDADAALQQALAQQAAAEQAARLQQQEEARLAKIAEEKAAQDAAAAQLKAARLADAGAAARRQLDEAAAFVRANRDDPQLLDHLQHITDLNNALTAGDPEPIERMTDDLTKDLATDATYRAFAAQSEAERQREVAHDLQEAVQALALQKRFLIDALAQDPTSPEAGHLLDLAKQVDPTVAAADLTKAQTLVGTIDAAIAKAGLSKSFAAAKLTATGQPAAAPVSAPPPVAATMAPPASPPPTPTAPVDPGPDRS